MREESKVRRKEVGRVNQPVTGRNSGHNSTIGENQMTIMEKNWGPGLGRLSVNSDPAWAIPKIITSPFQVEAVSEPSQDPVPGAPDSEAFRADEVFPVHSWTPSSSGEWWEEEEGSEINSIPVRVQATWLSENHTGEQDAAIRSPGKSGPSQAYGRPRPFACKGT